MSRDVSNKLLKNNVQNLTKYEELERKFDQESFGFEELYEKAYLRNACQKLFFLTSSV